MDNTTAKTRLVRLSDSNLTISDPAMDVRERKVLDSAGEEIGHVDDLLLDESEQKVRFLQVAAGGLLGMGESKFLIPVDAVTGLRDAAVLINQTRERVTGAPAYDPELTEESYYDNVYGYYGYAPFWGAGYMYPGYPYFV